MERASLYDLVGMQDSQLMKTQKRLMLSYIVWLYHKNNISLYI